MSAREVAAHHPDGADAVFTGDRGRAVAAYVLQRTRRCHGFYGASSMERLPVEQALTDQTRAFKNVTF